MNERHQKHIATWLFTGCAMVLIMVVIGGITRLTGSGLSMVDWNVIMGAVPPLNHQDWQAAFEKYRQFPEFQKVNPEMTLSEFKGIFWWEYIHRMWGRLLGVVFLVPFFYFLLKKQLEKPLIKRLVFIFLLGGAQGVLGWIMVKSGLVDQPWVSPYRLTAHLILAFFLLSYMFWIGLNLWYRPRPIATGWTKKLRNYSYVLTALVSLQIIAGGFMAGHKAARSYPTFPTMNGEWLPEGLFEITPFWLNFFENNTTIQFMHRLLGVVVVLAVVHYVYRSFKVKQSNVLRNAHYGLLGLTGLQFLLGVLTVINAMLAIPVGLAVAHQAGAALLLLNLVFLNNYLHRSV